MSFHPGQARKHMICVSLGPVVGAQEKACTVDIKDGSS